MNIKIKKKKFSVSNILINIYVNIKESTLIFNKYQYIFHFIEMINSLMIMDIIFYYKRNFINYSTYLYFLNPIFYIEFLNNNFVSSNTTSLDESFYNNDQLSLFIIKIFNIKIYDQIYFWNYYIFKIAFIIISFIFFIIQSFNYENSTFKIIKKIIAIIIYIFYKPFMTSIIFLFTRNIFIQISHNYPTLNENLIFDLVLFIPFLFLVIIMYNLFIYAYGNNDTLYFIDSNILTIELFINFISAILLTLRFKLMYSIIFQCLWILLFFYCLVKKIKIFNFDLHSSRIKSDFIFDIISFSMIITRFISFLLIKNSKNIQLLKIFEIILFFLIIFFYFLLEKKKNIKFSEFNDLLLKKNYNALYGLIELFKPLNEILKLKTYSNKIVEKDKENIFKKIQINFQKYFCTEKDDYVFLNNDVEKIREIIFNDSTTINYNKLTTDNAVNDKYAMFNKMLLYIIKMLYKIAKNLDTSFNEKIREYLIYNKVLLFFLSEGKTFKTEYILKKFLLSKYFKNKNNILSMSIFSFFNFHFKNFEKGADENSMLYLIIFLKLNNKYLKMVKSFEYILDNFTRNKNDLYDITQKKSPELSKCIKNIMNINNETKDVSKIRENVEFEKLKLIEAIMFNAGYDNSIEVFDLANIETLVEKNNFFLLLFDKNELIIKKTPLIYYNITQNDRNLKNKNFFLIFPEKIQKSIIKEVTDSIQSKNFYKFFGCLENKNLLISLVKLQIVHLPTYNKKLYLSCSIEKLNLINNCLIVDEQGFIKKFGLFFEEYFGLNPEEEKENLNLYSLISIKELVFKNLLNNSKIYEFPFDKFYRKIQKHYRKIRNTLRINFNKNLEQLKLKLGKRKLEIKISVKDELIDKEKLYLITLNFENIEEEKITNFDTTKMTQLNQDSTLLNNGKISISASVASQTSVANFKERTWNITEKTSNKLDLTNNKLGKLSFIYNFLLIILALVICVIINISSNHFKNDYKNAFTIIRFATEFNYNNFYYCNKIIILNEKGEFNDKYEILSDIFAKNNIIINITEFLFYHNLEESAQIVTQFTSEVKYVLEKIDKNTDLYKEILAKTVFYNIDGIISPLNYEEFFPLIINYFYSVSQKRSEYYIGLPPINYGDQERIQQFPNLYDKYALLLIYNYPTIQEKIFNINTFIKYLYMDSFSNLHILTNWLFIAFVCCNIFSLVLLYISVTILNNKILNIIEKISLVSNMQITYLKQKIIICRLLLLNEIKASKANDQLKHYAKEANIIPNKKNYSSKSSSRIYQNFPNNNINNNINNNNNKQIYSSPKISKTPSVKFQFPGGSNNNQPVKKPGLKEIDYAYVPSKKKNGNYLKMYFRVLETLIIFVLIYVIFVVYSLPSINKYFSIINLRLDYLILMNDLSNLYFSFYFIYRYSIYFNTTYYIDNMFGMTNMYYELYGNYSFLMSNLEGETESKYKNLIDIFNSKVICNVVLRKQGIYEEIVKKICLSYDMLNTNFLFATNNFVVSVRQEFLNFLRSNRTNEDIINHFHSESFQWNNFIVIFYAIETLDYILDNYVVEDLNKSVNNLSSFLILMFVLMVLVEIINYIQSNIFILNKLTDQINNYMIMEKFFIIKDLKDKKEKKK